VFLYHKFLNLDLGHLDFTLAKQRRYLPVVLEPEEIARILGQVSERNYLTLGLVYGSGLRVSECLCLHVQDIYLQGCSLMIRNSKG
jgi:site-specific recombinase XerD